MQKAKIDSVIEAYQSMYTEEVDLNEDQAMHLAAMKYHKSEQKGQLQGRDKYHGFEHTDEWQGRDKYDGFEDTEEWQNYHQDAHDHHTAAHLHRAAHDAHKAGDMDAYKKAAKTAQDASKKLKPREF